MKSKFKGIRPSKINLKRKIQLFWNLKGHFHKIQVHRDQAFKISLKGKIQLFFNLKGHFHEIQV